MRVSVIIPVYNAAAFVERAVESALQQQETREVVLVDDGSTDESLEICRRLSETCDAVSLFTHPDSGNHGAGATRNLAIRKSSEPFIAFLDADDYYLEHRFAKAAEVFRSFADADGVYEAIGVRCADERSETVWADKGHGELSTIFRPLPPDGLMDALLDYNLGTISPDGLVIRRRALWSERPFCEKLRLHQDTAMIIQLSYYARLYPGSIEKPVAMRYVHGANRYLSNYNINLTRTMLWDHLFNWALDEGVSMKRSANIFRNALYFRYQSVKGGCPGFGPRPQDIPGLVLRILRHPVLFRRALMEHGRRRRCC